jgi:hypothetical protein
MGCRIRMTSSLGILEKLKIIMGNNLTTWLTFKKKRRMEVRKKMIFGVSLTNLQQTLTVMFPKSRI